MMTSKQTTYNIQHLPFLLFDINITEELLNLLGHQGSSSYYFVEFVLLNLSFRCRLLFFFFGGGGRAILLSITPMVSAVINGSLFKLYQIIITITVSIYLLGDY